MYFFFFWFGHLFFGLPLDLSSISCLFNFSKNFLFEETKIPVFKVHGFPSGRTKKKKKEKSCSSIRYSKFSQMDPTSPPNHTDCTRRSRSIQLLTYYLVPFSGTVPPINPTCLGCCRCVNSRSTVDVQPFLFVFPSFFFSFSFFLFLDFDLSLSLILGVPRATSLLLPKFLLCDLYIPVHTSCRIGIH